MTPVIAVEVAGRLQLKQQLQLLMLPYAKRRRMLHKLTQSVIRDSRKRVQTQTDLSGAAFPKRWRQRKDRRKMLSRLIRRARVKSNDGTRAVVGFYALDGYIAAKQQHGATETMSAAKLKQQDAPGGHSDPATKQQAAALKLLGFKAVQGKRTKAVTMRWMQSNLTRGQAGAIIRALRAKQGQPSRSSWTTVLPKRAFFGQSQREIDVRIQELFNQILEGIPHGR